MKRFTIEQFTIYHLLRNAERVNDKIVDKKHKKIINSKSSNSK